MPEPRFLSCRVATSGQFCSVTFSAGLLTGLAAALGAVHSSCEGAANGPLDLDRVKKEVLQIWDELDQEMARLEGSLLRGAPTERLPEPRVSKEGDELVVEFFLPQQLDVAGALLELRRQLRNPSFGSFHGAMSGSSVTEESTAGRGGKAWTLRRRSRSLGDLTVEVEQPRDPASHAWFGFRARGGLREQDLRLIAASMHSALHMGRRGDIDSLERGFTDELFEGLDSLGRVFGGVEPLFDHIQDFMKAIERMQQGELGWDVVGSELYKRVQQGGVHISSGDDDDGDPIGWGEERDTAPTPLRRPPKQLEDLPGSARGQPFGTEGGPGAGLEDEQAREQRRQQARLEGVAKKLQGMGAQVFLPGKKDEFDWGILAGYEQEKRQIEDTVLLALTHPDVYDGIAKRTRRHYSSNRPRAVLFEGPPGTGKTTSARVIATQAAVPLVYIPLEAIMSKWYGESERMLADMLKGCESFPDGCIIFLDELDALATSRGTDMHEATRRLLGVLLRHLDGFDANKRTVVIGATNRRQDLDPALISRFSATVTFDLPTEDCRSKILRQYAQHLSDAEVLALAHATPGMAGRDLRDVCEQAERHWASKIIRGKASKGQLPPLSEYLEAAQQRLKELAGSERGPLPFL
ncbi:hypothetical protein N2152v2_008772 [Parachlorella kessleri]